jgi:hypothetical protein
METPQKQKDALRRLIAVGKIIPLEKFYSITITRWGNVSLQGDFDKEVVVLATRNKFTIKANDLGYICFVRGKFDITLL